MCSHVIDSINTLSFFNSVPTAVTRNFLRCQSTSGTTFSVRQKQLDKNHTQRDYFQMSRQPLFFILLIVALFTATQGYGSATGACTDSSDSNIILNENAHLAQLSEKCGLECAISFRLSTCVSGCLVKSSNLTAPCSACYGADAVCSKKHCMSECIRSPSSNECVSCSQKYCNSSLFSCSGVSYSQK